MNERRLWAEARANASPLTRFRGVALSGAVIAALTAAPAAEADVWGTGFESPSYSAGDIHGQRDWSNSGNYDANVVSSSTDPLVATYGFGTKALQISNFKTSSSFADQTFTPSTVDEAGEMGAVSTGLSGGNRMTQFNAQFRIGSADSSDPLVTDRHVAVTADRGDGSPMTYLRFVDQSDGIHVFFKDGPSATATEITNAPLDRTAPHFVALSIDFVDGADNDVVTVKIDGALVHTGK